MEPLASQGQISLINKIQEAGGKEFIGSYYNMADLYIQENKHLLSKNQDCYSNYDSDIKYDD